jgi:hypothetical protein
MIIRFLTDDLYLFEYKRILYDEGLMGSLNSYQIYRMTNSLGFYYGREDTCNIRLRKKFNPLLDGGSTVPIERVISHEVMHGTIELIAGRMASSRYDKIWREYGDLP